MGLYILARDHSSPGQFRLIASCDGEIKPSVCVEALLQPGQYLLVPFSVHALVYARPYPFGFVLHSSRVVGVAPATVAMTAVAAALTQQTMRSGRALSRDFGDTTVYEVWPRLAMLTSASRASCCRQSRLPAGARRSDPVWRQQRAAVAQESAHGRLGPGPHGAGADRARADGPRLNALAGCGASTLLSLFISISVFALG